MKIYNVLTRKKEEFVPLNGNKVKMYVCGMTVNGEAHLGHARQVITFDMISQYLKFKGYDVDYASNYTDIDDRIIAQAKERGISPLQLADERIASIGEDMKQISVADPTYRPRVTKCIPEIIQFVQGLIDKGYAYSTPIGDVYFCVKKYHGYGTLSNRKIDDLLNSVRIEASEEKQDALDFALWKAVGEGEFGWDSPWGKGRPGWHIECSAMIKKFLGDTIDIHGGGKDLIFPHHENELAQSSCLNGCKLSNNWLHNGLITVDGQKMSKSLGNFVLVKDLLKKYHPEVIRYAFLINHYTSTLERVDSAMQLAEKQLYYFNNCLMQFNQKLQGKQTQTTDFLVDMFTESMDDDFNSAKFIADLFVVFADAQKSKDINKLASIIYGIDKIKDVLGIFRGSPNDFVASVKQKYIKLLNVDEQYVLEQIEKRAQAKQQKDYALADQIRNELDQKGIMLKDSSAGTDWDIKQLY